MFLYFLTKIILKYQFLFWLRNVQISRIIAFLHTFLIFHNSSWVLSPDLRKRPKATNTWRWPCSCWTWGKGLKWQVLENGLVHAGLEEKAENDKYLKMVLFMLDLRKRPKTTSTWRWPCSCWTWGKVKNDNYLKMALFMLDLRKRPKMTITWRWPCSCWTWGKGQKWKVLEDGLVNAWLEEKAENDKYLKMALFTLDLKGLKTTITWRWPCSCWT